MTPHPLTARFLPYLLLIVSTQVNADVHGIVQKIINAYGGESRVSEVRAFEQTGATFSVLRGKEGKLQRDFQYPDRLRIEIDYSAQDHELRLLAGGRSWRHDSLTGEPFYSAMLLQASRLGLPLILVEQEKYLRDLGTIEGFDGKPLHGLELPFHGHLRLIIGVDEKNGRIRQSKGILALEAFRMEFGTSYSDFRLQDGHLFAFKEEHYAMAQKTGYTHLESIKITPRLPPGLFLPQQRIPHKSATVTLAEQVLPYPGRWPGIMLPIYKQW
jgi:hypothetical protein